jgi:transaldolase
MKFFIDTADVSFIEQYVSTGLIDGVTTNPSNLSKQVANPGLHIEQLCALLPQGMISVEVTEEDPEEVYTQAHAIASMHENILVKIPCHLKYYRIIKQLVEDGIPLNITLVFSVIQATAMAKLGVTVVSPFVGRLEEINEDGIKLIEDIVDIYNYHVFDTLVLAASLRNKEQATKAIIAGADIITVTPELFVEMLQHPLTEKGMQKFKEDWSKLGIQQFP